MRIVFMNAFGIIQLNIDFVIFLSVKKICKTWHRCRLPSTVIGQKFVAVILCSRSGFFSLEF